MEKPSSSDPNFKAFLNKLKEQNGNESIIQNDSPPDSNTTKGELDGVKDSLKQGLQGVDDKLVKFQDRLETVNTSLLKFAEAIQGNALNRVVEAKNEKEDKEEVDNFDPSLLGRLKSFMTDGESDKPGHGLFQKPPAEVVKKEREDKVSSPREVNPEADNINTSAEIQLDAAKKDLELSKEMLDTTKQELTLLKEIKDALAPKTPAELGNNNAQGLGVAGAAGAALAPEASSSPGVNIDLPVPGLPDKKDGKPSKPGKEPGKAGRLAAKGLGKSLLKKIPVIGAVAGLAYGASRAMSGDFAGAGMEVASGLAGTIPGVGTAASVGIDAALAAKDAGVFDKEQAPATAPATAPVATASTSLGGAIAATADTSKKQEAMLTPAQEKEAEPLISEMLSLQKELLELNNNSSMPRDEYKAKRKEIGSKQAAITKQLDSIKPGFGEEVFGYTSGPGALDASKETSSSVIDKMKQDSKTISEESSKVISKEKVTGEKIISQTTTNVKTTSADSLTKDASSAQQSLVNLDEKYAKKAAPIVEKLRAEGKIDGVVTDEDYQQIPELQAIKKEKDAEKLSLEAKIKPGLVSSVSSEVVKTSTENADMSREIGGRGGANNTVVSNNVSSNNTTKFVPMKSSPRAENTGSALDRYTSRITTY